MARIARIISTGRYLPEIEVTNAELAKRFGETPAKLEARTGIKKRWYAPDDWSTSDLALRAAQQALSRAGRSPEDVDLIILGTDSHDYATPATSTVLQHKLGARNAGTFDVGCACASFPTALTAAAGWMAVNPDIETVLVVGVYMMHKLADPQDPTIFFYGDGAGAALLEAGEAPGFISSAVEADGSNAKRWGIFAGGTVEPASVEAVREGRTQVRMLERYPREVNEEGWPRLVHQVARNGGFELRDIDQLIFTQVGKPTIEIVMNRLELPMEKAHTVMEEFGYTGSACIPMALDHAIEVGKVKPGQLVVLVGSGVGHNAAATAFRL